MWYQFMNQYVASSPRPWFMFGLVPLIVWDLIIRGIALWKAARYGQKYWFVALLVVNSIGILPLIYILFFQKSKKEK